MCDMDLILALGNTDQNLTVSCIRAPSIVEQLCTLSLRWVFRGRENPGRPNSTLHSGPGATLTTISQILEQEIDWKKIGISDEHIVDRLPSSAYAKSSSYRTAATVCPRTRLTDLHCSQLGFHIMYSNNLSAFRLLIARLLRLVYRH